MKHRFPTNIRVLENYPNLYEYFYKEGNNEFSSKQIFRLLDNLHCPGIFQVVKFLEVLSNKQKYQQFIYSKLNSTDYSDFDSNLSELFLLSYLLNRGYFVQCLDVNRNNTSSPEFYISKTNSKLLIELYSPIELYGFDLFFYELQTAIKYYNSNIGFRCSIDVKYKNEFDYSPARYSYPVELNKLFRNDKVRNNKILEIISELFSSTLSKKIIKKFDLSSNTELIVKIKISGTIHNRLIITSFASHSVDTSAYFVSADCSSKGFYKKLYDKINKKQLVQSTFPEVKKIMFVNFIHSFGGDSLIKGEGHDILSNHFYNNLSTCLAQKVNREYVDFIVPVISGINEEFYIGKCVFSSKHNYLPKLLNAD